MNGFFRPTKLSEALAVLSEQPHRILAGGTDIYPAEANHSGWGKPALFRDDATPVLDLSRINGLHEIVEFSDRVELGARVSWTQALHSELGNWFDCVRLAAREVGGKQIQNRGTLAGNLCNASPAADGVPALMALNARVRLASVGKERELPVESFVTGNRSTVLEENELLTAVVIPKPPPLTYSTFLKLGARHYLVISIAMVAVALTVDRGVVTSACIAVGACSAVASRLETLETALVGQPIDHTSHQVRPEHFIQLTPIDDVRASASYRLHAVQVLVRRALDRIGAMCKSV